MDDLMEALDFLILLGINIFGIYALFKIGQIVYWYIKGRASNEEEL